MKKTQTTVFAFCFLCIFCGLAAAQTNPEPGERHRYKIDIKIDFENLSYTGTETVRWINQGEKPSSVIYFHLYPNLRAGDQTGPANAASTDVDEPRIDILEVRAAGDNSSLFSALDDQGTTLRVNLREPVASGASTDVVIKFKGRVPEIDRDETSLTTHVVKQVSAALRSDRETRRARDINFHCRGVMLLGTAYPALAVHDGDEWRRKVEPSVGDFVFNESADFEVSVTAPSGVEVFTSGLETGPRSDKNTQTFTAIAMRDFAILAGRGLRSEHTEVNGTNVRSIYFADHERVGKRALVVAANALRTFTNLFGPLPFKQISIAEAPLVAGLGSCEFSGLNVIASAFFVDFDSPAVRNLPEIIREQRPSVEESLEWTVAHLVAHQWWGAAVGNDPAREPILDEALSCWSSLLYYQQMYGAERASRGVGRSGARRLPHVSHVRRRRHGREPAVTRISQHVSVRRDRHGERRADVRRASEVARRRKNLRGVAQVLPGESLRDRAARRPAHRARRRSAGRTKADDRTYIYPLANGQTRRRRHCHAGSGVSRDVRDSVEANSGPLQRQERIDGVGESRTIFLATDDAYSLR